MNMNGSLTRFPTVQCCPNLLAPTVDNGLSYFTIDRYR